jgi:Concanavalin A-like lectin/glucanases superfamily
MKAISILFTAALLVPALSAQGTGLKLTNGVDTYVEVAHNATLVPKSGITVEAWVTYDETTLLTGWRYPTIIRHNMAAGKEQIMFRINADNSKKRVLKFFVAGTTRNASANWSFGAGALKTWTHVAGTYDGTTIRIFVNGKQVAQATGGGAIKDLSGKMFIGNGSLVAQATVPGMEMWHGDLDEVRLWPYARTAAEITQTMNLELKMMPGMVSTWSFNNDVKDSSGKNDGKIVGKLTFAANTLKLTPVPFPSSIQFGTGTKGCGLEPGTGIGGLPKLGSSLGIIGTNGAPNAAGFCILGGGRLQNPFSILGVNIYIAPASLALIIPTTGNTLGTHRVDMPIPSDTKFKGVALNWQYLLLDTTCKPAKFAATNGIFTGITN